MKIKKVKKGTIKPIQPFATLKDEAEYWDTHSMLDEVDKNASVGFHQASKTDTLTIRFDHEDVKKLQKEAVQKGIGISTLARIWLKERLQTIS